MFTTRAVKSVERTHTDTHTHTIFSWSYHCHWSSRVERSFAPLQPGIAAFDRGILFELTNGIYYIYYMSITTNTGIHGIDDDS